jgi:hypothetical protein
MSKARHRWFAVILSCQWLLLSVFVVDRLYNSLDIDLAVVMRRGTVVVTRIFLSHWQCDTMMLKNILMQNAIKKMLYGFYYRLNIVRTRTEHFEPELSVCVWVHQVPEPNLEVQVQVQARDPRFPEPEPNRTPASLQQQGFETCQTQTRLEPLFSSSLFTTCTEREREQHQVRWMAATTTTVA